MNYINKAKREYITGVDRGERGQYKSTHLYDGTFDEPGNPLCKKGWNRPQYGEYSIFRNSISNKGICRACKKRADLGLDGVE